MNEHYTTDGLPYGVPSKGDDSCYPPGKFGGKDMPDKLRKEIESYFDTADKTNERGDFWEIERDIMAIFSRYKSNTPAPVERRDDGLRELLAWASLQKIYTDPEIDYDSHDLAEQGGYQFAMWNVMKKGKELLSRYESDKAGEVKNGIYPQCPVCDRMIENTVDTPAPVEDKSGKIIPSNKFVKDMADRYEMDEFIVLNICDHFQREHSAPAPVERRDDGLYDAIIKWKHDNIGKLPHVEQIALQEILSRYETGKAGEVDDMLLPTGRTCHSCAYIKKCIGLFQCKPENIKCDWSPSRYVEYHEEITIPGPIERRDGLREELHKFCEESLYHGSQIYNAVKSLLSRHAVSSQPQEGLREALEELRTERWQIANGGYGSLRAANADAFEIVAAIDSILSRHPSSTGEALAALADRKGYTVMCHAPIKQTDNMFIVSVESANHEFDVFKGWTRQEAEAKAREYLNTLPDKRNAK